MRLALGTVEFGMDYGVAASSGRPSFDDIAAILDAAEDAGVEFLDTAPSYGDAEILLGRLAGDGTRFKVITKAARFDPTASRQTVGEQLEASLSGSLERLRREKIHALMLHGAGDLMGQCGDAVFRSLQAIKATGKVERIGVCLYDPSEAEAVIKHYPVDIVQLPMNVLDQRFLSTGVLSRLSKAGIEVHVRSAFLQGALLSETSALPAHLGPLIPFLENFKDRARQMGLSPLAMALQFLHAQADVSSVLVGVNTITEWRAIVACWRELGTQIADLSDLACPHEVLVSPRRWPELQNGDAA
jgi:aryl-alcohol dehydrogenase-like predicted oxidoreductase